MTFGSAMSTVVAPSLRNSASAASIGRGDVGVDAGAEVFARAGRSRRPASGFAPPSRASSARVVLGGRGRATSSRAGRGPPSRSAAARSPRAVRANGPGLVEARRERDQPVARAHAVGRLQPADAGQRRRLADRAAGVGAGRRRAPAARRPRPPSRRSCRPGRSRGSRGSSPGRSTRSRSTSPSRTRPCWSCRRARCRRASGRRRRARRKGATKFASIREPQVVRHARGRRGCPCARSGCR